MFRINWSRVIIGAIVAAIICFFTDGFFHEKVVSADWKAIYDNLGIANPVHNPAHLAYFALFELGRGFISVLLYALLRPHCRPGPKTAAIAGIIGWIAFSVTGPAQFIPLGFFSHALWLKVGAFHLITSIIATIAGAALYQDPANLAD
jgi:xanthosine utilization system XapX-like protein